MSALFFLPLSIFGALAFFLALAFLLALFKRIIERGLDGLIRNIQGFPPSLNHGEARVYRTLARHLDANWYTHYHNITFLLADGSTTQVDHLVISPFGILVIETKAINGWVFGTERDAQWTVKLGRSATNKFMNPLRQNYRHTAAIRELTGCPVEWLKPVVVFTETRTKFPKGRPAGVVSADELLPWVHQHREMILSREHLAEFLARLNASVLPPGRETEARHLAYLEGKRLKDEG